MSFYRSLVLLASLSSLCSTAQCVDSLSSDKNVIEYQIEGNERAVVLVQEEGVSEDSVKEMAMHKVAEVVQREGCSYFTIVSQQFVQVMHSEASDGGQQMPKNLYYELIETDDFGRIHFEGEEDSPTQTYPAYQVIFRIYKQKPSSIPLPSQEIP